MTIRRNPGPDDDADDAHLDAPQRWQHPSEVGLAVRGRTDRRRSSVIVAGLLIGGVGLLVSGVLLGSMDDGDRSGDVVAERIERGVANVAVVEDGLTTVVTGLVIDDEGHVAVRAEAIRGAEEIWARCDEQMEAATVVAVDDDRDLAVLRLASPAGRPVEVSEAVPRPGLDVLAVDAVPGAIRTTDATVTTSATSTPADRFHAELASSDDRGALVFDRAGQLMGMASDGSSATVVEVHTAAAMMSAAQRLLER